MKTIIELSLSGSALMVAIIALMFSITAINIEKNRDEFQLEQGKTALFDLTLKYFVVNFQRDVLVGNTHTFSLNDPIRRANYVHELELLALQFDDMINNAYFTVLYKKYPMIGQMSVLLRKEIMFISTWEQSGQDIGFSCDVWPKMFNTFSVLKNDISMEDNDWKKIVDDVYNFAKQVNSDMMPKK